MDYHHMMEKRHCLLVLKPHLDCCIFSISQCQGILSEVEGSVQLTSLYWPVQINCFPYWNYIFFVTKTTYLNEEVNCTEPSLSSWVPWSLSRVLWLQQKNGKIGENWYFYGYATVKLIKINIFMVKLLYFILGKLVKLVEIIKDLSKFGKNGEAW
jgi:hypothetical protein